MGVLTPKTEAVFLQAFGEIDPLPEVVGTVGGLKDVDPSEAWNGRETGDGRKDNGHNFKGPVFRTIYQSQNESPSTSSGHSPPVGNGLP